MNRMNLVGGLSNLGARAASDGYIAEPVGRPSRFEQNKYLGDKRSQIVYDLDLLDDDAAAAAAVEDVLASEQFLTFGPDTLAEARNRCYRPDRSIVRALRAEEADDGA
jgi:hypothetical protein